MCKADFLNVTGGRSRVCMLKISAEYSVLLWGHPGDVRAPNTAGTSSGPSAERSKRGQGEELNL